MKVLTVCDKHKITYKGEYCPKCRQEKEQKNNQWGKLYDKHKE